MADVTLDVPGLPEPATGRLVSIPPRREPMLNDLALSAGRYIEAGRNDEAIASRTFAEANGLRKAMGTFRGDGTLHTYEDRMVGRMIARGYDPDFARRCFEQIKGFGSYGFPESHAASFARRCCQSNANLSPLRMPVKG